MDSVVVVEIAINPINSNSKMLVEDAEKIQEIEDVAQEADEALRYHPRITVRIPFKCFLSAYIFQFINYKL